MGSVRSSASNDTEGGKMKKIVALFVLVMLLGHYALVSAKEKGDKFNPAGETYYTKANIWYEGQRDILSVNYHVGAMLPAGTKVKIISVKSNQIVFEPLDMKTNFTLVNLRKYSTTNLNDYFNQYFSKEDVKAEGGIFSKFTKEELANIKKGTVVEGMSKEAVLVAYGYPPSHRTPNIALDYWEYWRNKFKRDLVYFQDNKVIKIDKTMRPTR